MKFSTASVLVATMMASPSVVAIDTEDAFAVHIDGVAASPEIAHVIHESFFEAYNEANAPSGWEAITTEAKFIDQSTGNLRGESAGGHRGLFNLNDLFTAGLLAFFNPSAQLDAEVTTTAICNFCKEDDDFYRGRREMKEQSRKLFNLNDLFTAGLLAFFNPSAQLDAEVTTTAICNFCKEDDDYYRGRVLSEDSLAQIEAHFCESLEDEPAFRGMNSCSISLSNGEN